LIAHLRGKLIDKRPNSVIVEVGGVGYELIVPLSTFYQLGETGTEVSLYVYTHVREDVLQLYGFRTELEKRLFLHLTSATGIGPKLAVTILSGMSAEELIPAIRHNDLARLVAIPGVGKKTAERLVIELRDKLATLASPELEERPRTEAGSEQADVLRDDIVSALVNLGYQRAAAEKAVAITLKELPEANFETAIKHTLRKLTR
jgi:Holliday junction DNA helicase RuvA